MINVTESDIVASKNVLPKEEYDKMQHTRVHRGSAREIFSRVEEGERQDFRRIHKGHWPLPKGSYARDSA